MYNMGRENIKSLSIKGEHIGVCVNNNDPLKQEGCQYRFSGVHDGIADKDLPWVRPHRHGHANNGVPGTDGTSGSVGPIPPIGSTSHIEYPDDTMYNGKATGTPTTKTQQPPELVHGDDPTGKNYPHVHSHIDAAGNRHTYDHVRNTMDIEHASGAHITIDGKGHIGIKTASNPVGKGATEKHSPGLTIQSKGPVSIVGTDLTIGGSGTTKIMSTGNLHLGAKGHVYLSAGGSVISPKIVQASPQVGAVPSVAAPEPRSVPSATAPTATA